MNNNKTGAFITMRRKKLGFTQQQLAEKLNVSDKSISKWERGDGYPDTCVLLELAEFLNTTTDALLKGECKLEHNINTVEDVFNMLDDRVYQIPWDSFYQRRNKPAPFVLTPNVPDENLVKFLNSTKEIKTALELGCGEGRNAIYMAHQGVDVTAIDISEEAIANGIKRAQEQHSDVQFICNNVFNLDLTNEQFDFIYDSGMFHHLAPHRRITYLEFLDKVLEPKGYFGLTCFAWGENCADEVDDWEFYQKRRGGVAFSKSKLIDLFERKFYVLEIRKYEDNIPDTLQGVNFLWVCLFQKK